MSDTIDKAESRRREARLRRQAAALGLAIEKSRSRDSACMDYGCYRVVNPKTDSVVAGRFPYGYSLTLDAVGEVLDELEDQKSDEAIKAEWLKAHGSGGELDAKFRR